MLNKETIFLHSGKTNPYAPYHFKFVAKSTIDYSTGWNIDMGAEALPYWDAPTNHLIKAYTYDDSIMFGTVEGIEPSEGNTELGTYTTYNDDGTVDCSSHLLGSKMIPSWWVNYNDDFVEGKTYFVTFDPPRRIYLISAKCLWRNP